MENEDIPIQPKIYSAETGEEISVNPAEIESLIISGKAAFKKDEKIPVLNPQGKPVTIKANNLAEAFSNEGYRYEPIESQVKRAQIEDLSGTKGAVLAGLSSLASGASLGLSDQVLKRSGLVSEETLKNLEEAQPEISFGGQAVGTIAPMLLTGGTGVAAKVASKLPSALVGDAGIAKTQAVPKAL